ncbi:MAG: DNA replication/repair protein RecF [Oscillospiraceae bacterium]|jgi:DNA replication and repair protein RecF
MTVHEISLEGFRNYRKETVSLSPGINVISGENAQGKTNLLEAVFLLSCGRGFRTRLDSELISFDADRARVEARVFSQEREQTVSVLMARGQRKQILVNGVRKNANELSDTVRVVLFCPDDLNMIREGAKERRRFLDIAISQLRPNYAKLLTDYNRLAENKRRILSDWREKPALLDALDAFSAQMARAGAQLIRYRAAFCRRLAETASPIHSEFSGSGEELRLEYKTVSTVTDPFSPASEIYAQIMEHQRAHREAEIASESLLTGIHKDDLEVSINGRSARLYASQGQTRTAALSLKMAEREISMQDTGECPILLLDDVLSELDARRQEYVLNRIGGGQTLITCCEDAGIRQRTGGNVFTVSAGTVREGN